MITHKRLIEIGNTMTWAIRDAKIRQVYSEGAVLGVNVEKLIQNFGPLDQYGRPYTVFMDNVRELADTPPTQWKLENLLAAYVAFAYSKGWADKEHSDSVLAELDKVAAQAPNRVHPWPGDNE